MIGIQTIIKQKFKFEIQKGKPWKHETLIAPYDFSILKSKEDIANQEKKMPKNYITADGYGVTQEGIDYLSPLIQGEDYPPYKNGVPVYKKLANIPVKKKIKESYKL